MRNLPTGAGTLNINSGEFTVQTPVGVEAFVLVGTLDGSSGTINMSDGSFNIVNGYLSLGADGGSASSSGSRGQMTMTGGTVDLSGELRVGDDAVGTLNISGGNINSSLANIGRQLWGSGTVTMSGGTWTNDSLFVVGNDGRSGRPTRSRRSAARTSTREISISTIPAVSTEPSRSMEASSSSP